MGIFSFLFGKTRKNPEVLYQKALSYEEGDQVPKDFSKAFSLYKKASDLGYLKATNTLGIYYKNGWGVEKDEEKSFEYTKKAAEGGYAAAMNNLGVKYRDGSGVEQDFAKALEWLKKSQEAGNILAYYHAGNLYNEMGEYEKAAQAYTSGSLEGDLDCTAHIGWYYLNGLGVEQDKEKGLFLLKDTANNGNPEAMFLLGNYYQYTVSDYDNALKCYGTASDLGHSYSAESFDTLQEQVNTIHKLVESENKLFKKAELLFSQGDYNTALEYYKASSTYGDEKAISACKAAYILWQGPELLRNPQEAFHWMKDAAEMGNPSAASTLGYFYLSAIGTEQNTPEAVNWFQKAVDLGSSMAAYNLGRIYSGNYGMTDLELAAHYFEISLEKGNEKAREALDEVMTLIVNPIIENSAEEKKKEEKNLIEIRKQLAPYAKRIFASDGFSIGLNENGFIEAAGISIFDRCNIYRWYDMKEVAVDNFHVAGIDKKGRLRFTNDETDQIAFLNITNKKEWHDLVSIYTNDGIIAGIRNDKTVVLSGEYTLSLTDYHTKNWKDILDLCLGDRIIAGIKTNGTVVLTGERKQEFKDAEKWTDIVQIVSWPDSLIGLKNDGTVTFCGKCQDLVYAKEWTNIVSLAASDSVLFGIRQNGTAESIGQYPSCTPDVSEWTDIVSISAGSTHAIGLKKDGTAVATGEDHFGECSISYWENLIAVSAGYDHSLGLQSNGLVYEAGNPESFTETHLEPYRNRDANDWDLFE